MTGRRRRRRPPGRDAGGPGPAGAREVPAAAARQTGTAGKARPGATARRRIVRLVRRQPGRVVAVLVAVHVVLALLSFAPQPHTGGDSAAYVALGQSLLERMAYLELWDPAEVPHTKYPPVLPGVLAVAMALGLQPWAQLKLVILAFSAAAVAFSFLWLRARRRAALALGMGVLLAVAPGVLRESRWVLSDVPFWAFTMVALWAFERLRPGDRLRFGIAAIATLLAYFTRSAGLPLVVAALACLAMHRQWRRFAALGAIIAVPALLWWARTRAFAPAGYVAEFWLINPYTPALGTIGPADLAGRVLANLQKYTTVHLPLLLTEMQGTLLTGIGVLVFALALAGWLRHVRSVRRVYAARWRHGAGGAAGRGTGLRAAGGAAGSAGGAGGVAELFLPLYLGLIFIWPDVWSGERFLLPALTVLLFYAAEGLRRAVRRMVPRHGFAAGAAVLGLIALLAAPSLARAVETGRACVALYAAGQRYPCLGHPYWDDFFRMAEITGRALPADAVVLTRKPRLFYAISRGVPSRNYPFSDDPQALFAAADSAAARYLVFDRLDAVSDLYLRPVLARRPQAFCLLHAVLPSGTALFGIMPGAAMAPDLSPAELAAEGITFSLCGAAYWRDEQVMRLYGGMQP
jgi:hypothetical protein